MEYALMHRIEHNLKHPGLNNFIIELAAYIKRRDPRGPFSNMSHACATQIAKSLTSVSILDTTTPFPAQISVGSV
jgi:hypothetical protein